MNTLIKDSFLVVVTKIASLVLGLISSIFFIRLLGPDGKGDLTIIEVGVGLFFLATTFNVNISIVHFVAQKKMPIDKLLGLIISLFLASLAITFVVIFSLQLFGLAHFVIPEAHPTLYLLLAMLLLGINEIKEFLSAFLRGAKSFEDLYKSTLIYAVFRLLLFIGLYLLYTYQGIHFSTPALIGFHLLTLLVITVSIYRFFAKKYTVRPNFRYTYAEVKPFVLFSLFGLLTALLNFLSLKMDIWLVEWFEGTTQLGFYAVALGLGEMVSQIPASLRTVLLPYLSASKDKKEQVKTLSFFSKITCSATLVIAVTLYFMASFLLPLMYGETFIPAITPFKILLFAMVVFGFKAIFVMYNVAAERQQFNIYANIIGIITLVPLCFLFIPDYGIVGAAYAVLLSYFLSALYIFINALATKELPLVNYFVITPGDVVKAKAFLLTKFPKKNPPS